MKTVTIYCDGVGDAIALSGAIATLSVNGPVKVVTIEDNMVSVSSFFVNYPDVTITGISRSSVHEIRSLMDQSIDRMNAFTAGNAELQKLDLYWRMYLSLGVDYDCRWSCSPIRKASEKVQQHAIGVQDYIFIHEDPRRGFLLDRDKLPKGCNAFSPGCQKETSILAFKDAIEGATRLDLMDSCFFHLAEQLQPRGELFLHRYPRPYRPVIHDYLTVHKWTEVW